MRRMDGMEEEKGTKEGRTEGEGHIREKREKGKIATERQKREKKRERKDSNNKAKGEIKVRGKGGTEVEGKQKK